MSHKTMVYGSVIDEQVDRSSVFTYSAGPGSYTITVENVARALKEVGEIALSGPQEIPGAINYDDQIDSHRLEIEPCCKYADPVETGVKVRHVGFPDMSALTADNMRHSSGPTLAIHDQRCEAAFVEAKQELKRKMREWPTCPYGGTIIAVDDEDGHLLLICNHC